MAPEMNSNRGHGFGVDWWAIGILLYHMLIELLFEHFIQEYLLLLHDEVVLF